MTVPDQTPTAPVGDAAPLLSVADLTVEFASPAGPRRVVDGLGWEVRAGETLAVVGESGSGKSVSSLAVMGLLPASARISGEVRLAGTDLLSLPRPAHRRHCGERIAMVFQDALAALNPVYPVGAQLAEPLVTRRGMSRRAARARAVELLDLVRVPNARQRVGEYPHQFSGGMRQRVMIAMALTLDPDVLLADEPTTALDVTVQAQVMALLAEIQAERQMALVLITHDLGVVAGVADRVTVMYAGRAVEQAGVRDTFYSPAHPYTAALLRSVPRLATGEADLDADLPVIPGRPPEPSALPTGCAFHPRCERVVERCRHDPPPAMRLPGPDPADLPVESPGEHPSDVPVEGSVEGSAAEPARAAGRERWVACHEAEAQLAAGAATRRGRLTPPPAAAEQAEVGRG